MNCSSTSSGNDAGKGERMCDMSKQVGGQKQRVLLPGPTMIDRRGTGKDSVNRTCGFKRPGLLLALERQPTYSCYHPSCPICHQCRSSGNCKAKLMYKSPTSTVSRFIFHSRMRKYPSFPHQKFPKSLQRLQQTLQTIADDCRRDPDDGRSCRPPACRHLQTRCRCFLLTCITPEILPPAIPNQSKTS